MKFSRSAAPSREIGGMLFAEYISHHAPDRAAEIPFAEYGPFVNRRHETGFYIENLTKTAAET